ncbi:MAG: MFS transporter [Mycobacteriales bacterium]
MATLLKTRSVRPRNPIDRDGRRASIAALVLVTGQFMANIDNAVANVAGPAIRADLHASGSELQLVVSGFVLAYAVLLITGARLGTLFGYRRMFLTGLAAFTLTSLACGLAPDATALIVARIFQGASAAMMVPQVLTGIQRAFDGPRRAKALGWYALALSAGAVAGQVLGGVLISADLAGLGWRPVFLINVPLGVALLAVAPRALPADDRSAGRAGERLDLHGVALLSATVLLAVVPLVLGRDLHWPVWGWVCLAASLVGLARFAAVQRRTARRGGHPLVNPGVLGRPAVSWGLFSYAAAVSTYFAMLFVLALYLQQGLGHSALYSGMALVSWVAAFGVAGPLVRRLPSRNGRPAGATGGPLVLAAAHAGISVSLLLHHLPGALLMTLLGVGGLGLGTAFTAMIGHLTGSVPREYAPDLSGLIPTTAQLAGVLGVATFGTGYLAIAGHSPRLAFMVVTAAFAVTAALAAVTARRAVAIHSP